MKRDLKRVIHLLNLVQAHADHKGIAVSALVEQWTASSKRVRLEESECLYLIELCAEARLLIESTVNFTGGKVVQLTWKGHDYLDADSKARQTVTDAADKTPVANI